MTTSRPAFPESLPPKTQLRPPAVTVRHVASTTAESTGILKIVLAFIVVATLGNLALTLFLNRSRETSTAVATASKEAQMIEEMAHIRAELVQNRVMLANSAAEIGRMKVAYTTVIAQVGATNAPHLPHYSVTPNNPPVETLTPADVKGVQPNANPAGGQIK